MKEWKAEELKQMLLSINNRHDEVIDRSDKVEKSRIYTPDGTDGAWYYSHHPFITKFKGKFYAFYSNGRRNEDDCGQRIMMAVSEDFKSWTIKPLIQVRWGTDSELVHYCKGCYVYNGVLTVYYHSYEYLPEVVRYTADGLNLRPLAENHRAKDGNSWCVQTTDGEHFTSPKSLGNVFGGGNLNPVRYGERLLWAGYGTVAHTENMAGDGDWNSIRLRLDPETERPKAITESGIYQTPDGVTVLMSRTNGGTQLAAASLDGGVTWTDMYRSSYPDYCAKFEYGSLSDGRIYFLGNDSNKRAELVLCTSEDGVNFGRYYLLSREPYEQMRQGLYKGGDYGYPTSYFDEEYLYVIYSLDKEGVEALRIRWSELDVK